MTQNSAKENTQLFTWWGITPCTSTGLVVNLQESSFSENTSHLDGQQIVLNQQWAFVAKEATCILLGSINKSINQARV